MENIEIMDTNIGDDNGIVFREKEINAAVTDLQRRFESELYTSCLYNIGFWVLFITGIFLLVTWETYLEEFPQFAAGLVCLSLAFVVFAFNVCRFGDRETYKYSVVMGLLQNSTTKEHFIDKMQRRNAADAKILANISMKENVFPKFTEDNHWSKTQRSVSQDISHAFSGCTEESVDRDVRRDLPWPVKEAIPCRVIVSKIFKAKDDISKMVFMARADDFCQKQKYQENRRYLQFQYMLGFTNEETIPDLAETYLIHTSQKSFFFNTNFYTVSKLLSLDSLYRLVFKFKTRNMDVLELKKTMQYSESQA